MARFVGGKRFEARSVKKSAFEILHHANRSTRLCVARERNDLERTRVTRLSTIRSVRITTRKRLFAGRCDSVTPVSREPSRGVEFTLAHDLLFLH